MKLIGVPNNRHLDEIDRLNKAYQSIISSKKDLASCLQHMITTESYRLLSKWTYELFPKPLRGHPDFPVMTEGEGDGDLRTIDASIVREISKEIDVTPENHDDPLQDPLELDRDVLEEPVTSIMVTPDIFLNGTQTQEENNMDGGDGQEKNDMFADSQAVEKEPEGRPNEKQVREDEDDDDDDDEDEDEDEDEDDDDDEEEDYESDDKVNEKNNEVQKDPGQEPETYEKLRNCLQQLAKKESELDKLSKV